MRALRISLVLALALSAGGCAHLPPQPAVGQRLSTPAGTFELRHEPGDEKGAAAVREGILAALPALSRWGGLRHPVTVEVVRDHGALEKVTGREGYGWLRAWARYDKVIVQSPQSWGLAGPAQWQVNELMRHELAHCVMYQQAAEPEDWGRKGIPVWFREGMASVSSDQGYRRGSLKDLRRWLRGEGLPADVFADVDRLYRDRNDAVYTASHHAFSFLLARYGDGGVKRVLARMRSGDRFDRAFEEALGIGRPGFEQEFRNYVGMDGWRSGGPGP